MDPELPDNCPDRPPPSFQIDPALLKGCPDCPKSFNIDPELLKQCPKLPKCSAVYTLCDQQFERECRAARREFLRQLRQYDEETLAFFKLAREKADSLWELSVRYNILKEACPRPMYPKEITDLVTDEVLAEKDLRFSKMKSALYEWLCGATYTKLRADYTVFHRTLQPIKWSYPSALITGNAWEKPLKWYVDNCLDVMYYFERVHTHIEATFLAIRLVANDSMDAYKATLAYSKQFDRILRELLLFARTLIDREADESVESSRRMK